MCIMFVLIIYSKYTYIIHMHTHIYHMSFVCVYMSITLAFSIFNTFIYRCIYLYICMYVCVCVCVQIMSLPSKGLILRRPMSVVLPNRTTKDNYYHSTYFQALEIYLHAVTSTFIHLQKYYELINKDVRNDIWRLYTYNCISVRLW